MKLKMSTIIIILIFLLTHIILIGFLTLMEQVKRSRVRVYLDNSFKTLARDHNLSIQAAEVFRKKAIGLDLEKKKLVYIDKGRKKPFEICLYLNDFKFCLLSERKDLHTNTAKILLELVGARKNENVVLSLFHYTADTKYARVQLTKKAQYWKDKINRLINAERSNTNLEYVV